jgi:hypothetical protein
MKRKHIFRSHHIGFQALSFFKKSFCCTTLSLSFISFPMDYTTNLLSKVTYNLNLPFLRNLTHEDKMTLQALKKFQIIQQITNFLKFYQFLFDPLSNTSISTMPSQLQMSNFGRLLNFAFAFFEEGKF